MNKFKNITGYRFGKLIVIEIAGKDKGFHKLWLCKCDCGKSKTVRHESLLGGRTKSCGCLIAEASVKRTRLKEGEAGFNRLFYSYKVAAKNRSLIFELSNNEFKELTKGNCIYCSSSPSRVMKHNYYGEYVYNGIDRVDNSKGYILENCVSCCSICNRMKSNMTHEEFISHISKIYKMYG